MHYYKTIYVKTFTEFLQMLDEWKGKGYCIYEANAGKQVVFDGKNTVDCEANVCAILTNGTATCTIICMI